MSKLNNILTNLRTLPKSVVPSLVQWPAGLGSASFRVKFSIVLRLAVVLIIFAVVVGVLFMLAGDSTEAGWFNDNWSYRVQYAIGNTGAADSDKKVQFDIDTATLITAGKLQADCGDSRFTDVNGQVLRYFIDSGGDDCNDAGTDYYVLIPTINGGADTTIIHYYGNASAVNGTEAAQFSEGTFSPTSGPTAESEEIGPGPSAYWSFDSGYGAVAQDHTENNNDATISGATWQSEDMCITGKCLLFDGANDYAVVSDSASLSPTSQLTVGGWIKMADGFSTANDHSRGIVDKGAYQLFLDNSDGKTHFVMNDSASDAFSALGTGANAYVASLAVWNNELYAGGNFTSAGGVANTRYIAKWDGSSWSALGTGMNDFVETLAVWNGDLYAGGDFTSAGGVADTKGIARWDGTSWNAVGGGLGNDGKALAVWNDNLYVGGNFSNQGGDADADNIAKWDGSNWSAVGTGTNGNVLSIAVWNNDLYAGGNFTSASGVADTNRIAKWDGSSWAALSTGANDHVRAITVWNNELYAGGDFTSASGVADTNRIAKWDGSSWNGLSTGLNGSNSYVLTVWNGDLYIGGAFTSAGGVGTPRIVKWGTSNTKSVAGTTTSFTAGNWYHVMGAYDGSNMRVYVNGEDEGAASTTITVEDTADDMYIGGMHGTSNESSGNPSGEWFKGFIDDLKVYPYGRSAAEIKTDYIQGAGPHGSSAVLGIEDTDYLSEGLVGYWAMEGIGATGPSQTVSDLSGNGNDGTTYDGGVDFDCTGGGKFGNGCDFDGSDDYISAGDPASGVLDIGTGSFTTAIWAKINSGASDPTLLEKGGTGNDNEGYWFRYNTTDNNIELRYDNDSGGDRCNMDSNQSLGAADDTWHHFAAVLDRSPTNDIVYFYLDGVFVGSEDTSAEGCTGNDDVDLSSSNPLLFGRDSTYDYYGAMDEARIYNRALTSSEVEDLYNWSAGPVAHWSFDSGSGTSAQDISGNGNTGTMGGTMTADDWVNGKFGRALDFDGANDYLVVSDSTTLSPTSALTIEGYVYMSDGFSTANDHSRGIIDKGAYQLFLDNSDGKAHFVMNDNASDAWSALGTGMDQWVNALTVWKDELYAGGKFTSASGVADTSRIAKWDGSSWSALGTGANDDVRSTVVWNGDLYVGGIFTSVSGIANTSYIAKWDGSSWSAVSTGLNDEVQSFAVWNGDLYVGGKFTNAGGDGNADRIVKWDGSSWTALNTGLNGVANALAVWEGNLYAGGAFANAGGDANADSVAKWDGSSWSALATGTNGNLRTFGVWNGDLYAGGTFTSASGTANTRGIAHWDGSSWSALGTGLNNDLWSIAVWNGDLYAGGEFTSAGGVADTAQIARWDGSSWSALDTGTENSVYSFAVWNGDLYAGGNFTSASGVANTNRIAKWGTSNTKSVIGSTSSFTANTWYHLAGTYDGANMKVYVDGVEDGSAATTITVEDTTYDLYIGGMHGSSNDGGYSSNVSGEWFKGFLDDIRIYNYARIPKQIVEDMNAGHPAPGSPVGSTVAEWSFDDGYGTVQDQSVNNNDLILNTASWTQSGKYGLAWDGDGSAYLYLSDDADVDFAAADDFTISGWFKHAAASATEVMVYKFESSDADGGYSIQMESDGDITFGIDDDNTAFTDTITSTAATYDDGAWHHFVAIKNGTTDIRLYIDGLHIGTTAVTETGTLANDDDLFIGDSEGTDDGDEFNGDIDELKFYRFALTADQVKVEYNKGSSIVLGSFSTESDGTTPSHGSDRSYCVPGDTSTCNAPIAEWKLDEGTGTSTVYDTSGNGYDGTMSGSMTESDWVPGKFGSGLDFDGSNDRITITHATAFDFGTSTDITVSGWYKITAYGTNQDLFSSTLDTGSGKFQAIYDDANSRVEANIRNASVNCRLDGTTDIADGTWHHVEIVYNRNASCTTSDILIYIDGVAETTNAGISTGNTDIDIDSVDFEISGNTNTINGLADEVRIYNYVRTPAQIAWDYNQGEPLVHYKFDECEGITAYNAVPDGGGGAGGNDGTVYIVGSGTNASAGTCSSGDSTEAWNNGTTGKIQRSLDFDGTDDYVAIADTANLRFDANTADFSLAAWVKRTTTGTEYIISKEDADDDGYRMQFDSGNTVTCSEDGTDVTSVSTITDSNWHHIGCTIDRDGNGQVYIDGRADGAAVAMGTDAMATTTAIRIGVRSYTPTSFINGQVDNVKIFNYALTADQVQTEFNNGAVSFW